MYISRNDLLFRSSEPSLLVGRVHSIEYPCSYLQSSPLFQLPPPTVAANLYQQSFTRQLAFGQLSNGTSKTSDFYNNQTLSLAAKILSVVIILATLILIMISTRPRE